MIHFMQQKGNTTMTTSKMTITGLAVATMLPLLADSSFTGAVSSSWGEEGNWNPTGVPATGNVTIPDGKTAEISDADLASVNALTTLTLAGTNATVIFETDNPFTCSLAGNGEVIKTGSGTWTLTKDQSGFSGAFTLAGGLTKLGAPGRCSALGKIGSTARPLTVTNSATLDLCCDSSTYSWTFDTREVCIAGNGYDGNGALINSGKTAYGVFKRLTLVGDAKINFASRITSPNNGAKLLFNMNGYDLVHSSKGEDIFYYGSVTNAGRHLLQGVNGASAQWRIMDTFGSLGEADGGPIEVGNYAYFNYYGAPKQVRPLKFSGSTKSYVYPNASRGWDTNYNNFAGPTEVAAGAAPTITFTDSKNFKCMFTLSGPLTGSGNISASGGGKLGLACPTNATPAFTGNITIDGTGGGSLVAFYPASIPDYSKLSVSRSRVTVPMDTWSRSDILQLANTATFTSHAVVEINTAALGNQTGALALADADIVASGFGLGHDGPGTLNLSGPFTKAIKIGVHDGTLRLTGNDRITLGEGTVGGDGGSCSGTLAIEDAPNVALVENTWLEVGGAYPSGGNLLPRPKMTISNATFKQETAIEGLVAGGGVRPGNKSPGRLEFGSGAKFSGRISSGHNGTYGFASIRQTGGDVWLYGKDYEDNGSCQNSVIGYEGYSHWDISSGSLTFEGWTCFAHWGANCQGVLEQTGGTVTHKLHRHQPSNGGSRSQHWAFGNLNNAIGAYYLRGGTLYDEGTIFVAYTATSTGIMTIEGPDAVANVTNMIRVGYWPGMASSTLCLANGGTLRTPSLYGPRDDYRSATNSVNFNGGILRTPVAGGSDIMVAASILNLFVYSGGATFDTDGRPETHINTPIRAPSGLGVVAAEVPSAIAGVEFLGTPVLKVTGDGIGAVVAANWDRTTRTVTGVRIVSPGSGYTRASLVVRYGISNFVDSAALTLGEVFGGGITKAGAGTLVLNATNTYSGATVLAGGTLKCAVDCAIPLGSQVVLAGGTLDMNGMKFSDGSALPTNWAVDINRVKISGAVSYDSDLTFAEGATLSVLNLDSLGNDEQIPRTIFNVTGKVTGKPTVVVEPNRIWSVAWTENHLRLTRNRGVRIVIR